MNHSTVRINYDRISKFYDLFAGTGERKVTNLGLRMVSAQVGERVLEIGFGTGHSLLTMATAVGISGKVYGIDISKGMLAVTQNRLKKTGHCEMINLQMADAICIPLKTSSMDAIFSSFTLELFDLVEIPIVLKECHRVLHPKGRIGFVSLVWKDRFSVRLYEWIHSKFPDFFDCTPIILQDAVEKAGFHIQRSIERTLWGLPIGILTARKHDCQ
jgi:ubiquinone/menaquinone biosynthesis C-methylase UbiE